MPLGCLPEDKDAPLIVHCKAGARATKAVAFLQSVGYTKVLNAGGPKGPPALWSTMCEARGVNDHQFDSQILIQLFDPPPPAGAGSSTFTYILADPETKQAILIDPVLEQVERDLEAVSQLGCTLTLALNTHCHADHITGTGELKKRVPQLKSVISAASGAKADMHLEPGQEIVWADGRRKLQTLPTPGHTNGCVSFYDERLGAVFTGDALLIGGCGRTDFQEGSSETLYDSVHAQLFTLPPSTIVFPAHDYKQRLRSTVGAEKATNPRLTKTKEGFVKLMSELGLPYPKQIDRALPANLMCGVQD